MKIFGPVPSRRLGSSLGVNNIPAKNCSYSCTYCQLGPTEDPVVERQNFYDPEDLRKEVVDKVARIEKNNDEIDYLSFVPDGEPTLEVKLGEEIDLLASLEIKIAVISNSTLINDKSVRTDLEKADWVSLKVDAAREKTWQKINRPYESLDLDKILAGITRFSEEFEGTLTTETMLVEGLNNGKEDLERTARFIGTVAPDRAYLSVPTRPPAEDWVKSPNEDSLNRAFQIFDANLENVEYLIGKEGNQFSSSGDPREDLLSITSVHPMREEGVKKLLDDSNENWSLVEELIEQEQLIRVEFGGDVFYLRKLPNR